MDVDIGIGFEREGIFGDIGVKESRKDEFLELVRKALMRRSWLVIEAANRFEKFQYVRKIRTHNWMFKRYWIGIGETIIESNGTFVCDMSHTEHSKGAQ